MTDDAQLPAASTWPPGRALADGDALATTCAACGAPWRVHRSLAGFRVRCNCGAWVEAPAPLPPTTTDATRDLAVVPAETAALVRDAQGMVTVAGDPDATILRALPTDAALAPGTLRRASPANQARWTNRTLLEFVAMFAALLGPQLAALWWSRGNEFELLLPFVSLCSGALVAVVVAFAGPYGRLGLRAAAGRYFAEALLAAGVGLACAVAWVALLHQASGEHDTDLVERITRHLGLPAALLVIAVTPAVLEELMFRGVLQGRLLALFGTRLGLLATAAAFAICHAQPAVLPLHLGLGLYLGWLRERAGSLYPGMLMHFAYNGSIVVLGIG